jgi:hypothetical protein
MIPLPRPEEWPAVVKDFQRRMEKLLSDASKCRINGWGAGTVLEGDEGYGPTRIVLTAIGEEKILARRISENGIPCDDRETGWTLQCREWHKVEVLVSQESDMP